MNCVTTNLVFWVSDHVRHNQAVQPQKMARGLKFRILKVEGLYYLCRKNKALISCTVTSQLICVFVFAYAKIRFSHDAAQIELHCDKTREFGFVSSEDAD